MLKTQPIHKNIFENSNDAMLILKNDLTLLDANKKACRLFDYPKKKLIGNNIFEKYFKPELAKFCWEAKNTENARQLSSKSILLNKHHGKILLEVCINPVYTSDGVIMHVTLKEPQMAEKEYDDFEGIKKYLPFTEKEKLVYYGIVKYPLFNDIELSNKLNIKRTTITSIKNKLKKEGLYRTCRIPNFSFIGFELLNIFYAKMDASSKRPAEKLAMLKEISDTPEQVFFSCTEKELIGIYISKNLTSFKKHADGIMKRYREHGLIEFMNVGYFPLEFSRFHKVFDYAQLLGSALGLEVRDKPSKKQESINPFTRRLTGKEKEILCALVKFPHLNDSQIFEKTKIPRPSISQTRRRLVQEGFLKIVNIPDIKKVKCEVLALHHIKFNSAKSFEAYEKIMEYMSGFESCNFMVSCDFEFFSINAYKSCADYESEHDSCMKYLKESNLVSENPVSMILPLKHVQMQRFDFAPMFR